MPESKAQQQTVARVMHEAKHGALKTAAGKPVRSRKQAAAIALHEAGASRDEDAKTNRRNFLHTKAREMRGGAADGGAQPSRAALYVEAKRRGVAGRSKMTRAELAASLR